MSVDLAVSGLFGLPKNIRDTALDRISDGEHDPRINHFICTFSSISLCSW